MSLGSLLCAGLLLLHLLALVTVSGLQLDVNPRGWQAAREAERAATAARWAKPLASQPSEVISPEGLAPGPALQPAAIAHTCSLSGRPEHAAQQEAAWRKLVAAAAAAFVVGLALGAALHAVLQRRRRHAVTARDAMGDLSVAASCVGTLPGGRELHPAGPAEVPPAPAQQPGTEQSDKLQAPPSAGEAGASTKAASSTLAAAAEQAASAAGKEEGVGESPGVGARGQPTEAASDAAVAAAVQEIVLQAGSGAQASNSISSGVAQPDPAATASQEHADAATALLAMAPGGGAAGALGMLRSEDQADVAAAAQLVLTMCRSMHVDPGQLSRGERLQLIYTMLHAWQAQQARRHSEQMHRLGSEANALRGEQRDISARAAAHRAAKDAYRLSLERTAEFRRMCSDTLTFGMVVMLAAGTYQLTSRGLFPGTTASCGSLSAALRPGSGPSLWALWRAGQTTACYVLGVGDAVFGFGVLLAAPWLLYRSGLMSDYNSLPVSKLFIGLGMVCGLCGFLAVGKLGGSRTAWLATWEAWVVLHIALSAAAHRLHRVRLRVRQGAEGLAHAAAGAAGSMYEEGHGWLPAAMWLGLGLALPAMAGTLPFLACFSGVRLP